MVQDLTGQGNVFKLVCFHYLTEAEFLFKLAHIPKFKYCIKLP